MDHKVVIWQTGGDVRILHGIDPNTYKDMPNCLVDPEIPRGIPPHNWVLKDGKIEGAVGIPTKPATRIDWNYALGFISGIILTLAILCIMRYL